MKLLIPNLELMFSFFIPLIVSIIFVIISVIGFSAGRSFFCKEAASWLMPRLNLFQIGEINNVS